VASTTEAYYSFDHANIHFVCLDSYGSNRLVGSPMLEWLERDLAANRLPWTIAFWHHPPFSKGSHNSDYEYELYEMRENALPILEAHGVDLVLAGHSHSYERSYLIDGHYGVSSTFGPENLKDSGDGRPEGDGAYTKTATSHAGAVFAVAGSSGQTSGGTLDHPAMWISLDRLGSMVLDVEGTRLDAVFLNDAGVVDDRFTIRK
jgi:3',5'-cyclic AMP phosphodiesterase CpdA